VVFSSLEDLAARVDAPDLDIGPDDVMVLQNAGPIGGPGMPEAGYLPIPKKLLAKGVRDMVRISDARMSGTAFGTVVLHVSPEAAIGGPLGLVHNGDEIELDVATRRLELCVSETELNARRMQWQPPAPAYARGYGKLFLDHVLQAQWDAISTFSCRSDARRTNASGRHRAGPSGAAGRQLAGSARHEIRR